MVRIRNINVIKHLIRGRFCDVGFNSVKRVIMLEGALPRISRDEIDETSPQNPVELFRKVRDKWLIDGESNI